jgi:hypothetical protein
LITKLISSPVTGYSSSYRHQRKQDPREIALSGIAPSREKMDDASPELESCAQLLYRAMAGSHASPGADGMTQPRLQRRGARQGGSSAARPVIERVSGLKSSKQAPIGWHTLRRSLATLLISNGENVKVTQSQLRHTTPKITLDLCSGGFGRPAKGRQKGRPDGNTEQAVDELEGQESHQNRVENLEKKKSRKPSRCPGSELFRSKLAKCFRIW